MSTVKVKVPADVVDEHGTFRVSYAGDEPTTYKPKDGQVAVEPHHLDRFLLAVPGAETVGAAAVDSSAPSRSGEVKS